MIERKMIERRRQEDGCYEAERARHVLANELI